MMMGWGEDVAGVDVFINPIPILYYRYMYSIPIV